MPLVAIAGFDPSGGAGVLIDTAVFRSFGFEAAAVLTAVTAQNTRKVYRLIPLPAGFLRDQIRALERDEVPAGLKVGMAGSAENLEEIGRLLARRPDVPRVVDPVFRSSSGQRLDGAASVKTVLRVLRGNASVLTPNLAEAARLAERPVRTISEMGRAAAVIFDRTGVPCLVKGGHLPDHPVNLLFDGRREHRFPQKRIADGLHGTGCLFSAALLCCLVRTGDLTAAAEAATAWTHRAIRAAARTGHWPAVLPPPPAVRPRI